MTEAAGQDAQDWATGAEAAVLDHMLQLAPTQGWTWPSALAAGAAAGLSAPETELLIPRGPEDLAALLSRRLDSCALGKLEDVDPGALKVRERIRTAVTAHLDAGTGLEAGLRRWAGWLALPHHLPLAATLAWASADGLWRWAGDRAADENHYTKRVLLGGILTGARAIWLDQGRAAALDFVDRRIADVMSFEAWKAGLGPVRLGRDLAEALGRLRYR